MYNEKYLKSSSNFTQWKMLTFPPLGVCVMSVIFAWVSLCACVYVRVCVRLLVFMFVHVKVCLCVTVHVHV